MLQHVTNFIISGTLIHTSVVHMLVMPVAWRNFQSPNCSFVTQITPCIASIPAPQRDTPSACPHHGRHTKCLSLIPPTNLFWEQQTQLHKQTISKLSNYRLCGMKHKSWVALCGHWNVKYLIAFSLKLIFVVSIIKLSSELQTLSNSPSRKNRQRTSHVSS